MFSFEYCRIFNINCFEKHLQTAGSIKYYFNMINLKQCGFCTTYYIKILVSERKYKNNLKNRESKKKIFFFHTYICLCNALQEILWFFKDFEWKSVFFLYLYSILNLILSVFNTETQNTELILSPPKWGTKHLYNSKDFSFMPKQI